MLFSIFAFFLFWLGFFLYRNRRKTKLWLRKNYKRLALIGIGLVAISFLLLILSLFLEEVFGGSFLEYLSIFLILGLSLFFHKRILAFIQRRNLAALALGIFLLLAALNLGLKNDYEGRIWHLKEWLCERNHTVFINNIQPKEVLLDSGADLPGLGFDLKIDRRWRLEDPESDKIMKTNDHSSGSDSKFKEYGCQKNATFHLSFFQANGVLFKTNVRMIFYDFKETNKDVWDFEQVSEQREYILSFEEIAKSLKERVKVEKIGPNKLIYLQKEPPVELGENLHAKMEVWSTNPTYVLLNGEKDWQPIDLDMEKMDPYPWRIKREFSSELKNAALEDFKPKIISLNLQKNLEQNIPEGSQKNLQNHSQAQIPILKGEISLENKKTGETLPAKTFDFKKQKNYDEIAWVLN